MITHHHLYRRTQQDGCYNRWRTHHCGTTGHFRNWRMTSLLSGMTNFPPWRMSRTSNWHKAGRYHIQPQKDEGNSCTLYFCMYMRLLFRSDCSRSTALLYKSDSNFIRSLWCSRRYVFSSSTLLECLSSPIKHENNLIRSKLECDREYWYTQRSSVAYSNKLEESGRRVFMVRRNMLRQCHYRDRPHEKRPHRTDIRIFICFDLPTKAFNRLQRHRTFYKSVNITTHQSHLPRYTWQSVQFSATLHI